jgi:hypothetical protein
MAEYVKHAWPGAWVCSAFRSEGTGLASELIREAVAATRDFFDVPAQCLVTFIDREKVKPIMTRGYRTWGRSWVKAGFRQVGETKGGLLAFQLLPDDMPLPKPARPRSMHGMPLFDFAEATRERRKAEIPVGQ